MARAIAQDPEFLILDEPTSFLDYPHRVSNLFFLLRQWAHTQQRAVLMSCHDIDLAMSLADRIFIINEWGRVPEGISRQ